MSIFKKQRFTNYKEIMCEKLSSLSDAASPETLHYCHGNTRRNNTLLLGIEGKLFSNLKKTITKDKKNCESPECPVTYSEPQKKNR